MKKSTTSLFNQMSTKQLENLTTVINETLAMDLYQPKVKIFTAADMWNIQRQGRSRTQRRMSF
ncbi:MAG: hypothetical protein ABIQ31_19275 [Ferruginibacter sp.]